MCMGGGWNVLAPEVDEVKTKFLEMDDRYGFIVGYH